MLAAARGFRPGQFYRLQNFETRVRHVALDGQATPLLMEGLALTGAWVDRERGLVSLITLEMGGSSDLCAMLRPGEPVILMGPTGEATHIAGGETVVLCGGGLGNAVLFSIGKRLIGIYLGNSAVASSYGAAGSVVALMLWVYYSAQIFFFT